ncbi:MAG TPA: hypothetical protein VL978_18575 [Puia sp.]|nr:hypothetical protein [Puia sp.]
MLKKFANFFPLAIAAILFACPTFMTSCTKTTTVTKTDTLTTVDTVDVPEKDTMVTTGILTANPWQAIYDRASVDGTIEYYVRGGSGNTMDLDNEYITFNSNNTGTYTDNNGDQTTFTWNFTDATDSTLVWTWNVTTPATTVTWEHLFYHDGTIRYTEYYYMNGVSTLSSEIRVPKQL